MNVLTADEMLMVSGGDTVPLDQIGDKNSSAYQIGHAIGDAARTAFGWVMSIRALL